MSTCQRFEQEGLLQLQQGVPLDPHFSTCAECVQARSFYEQLQGEIAGLGPLTAPSGWQRDVWTRIASSTPTRQPRRRWLYVAAAALAATVVAFMMLPSGLQRPAEPTLHVEARDPDGGARRGIVTPGATLVVGSRLAVRATIGRAPYAELRLYRNDDQLMLQVFPPNQSESSSEFGATVLLDAVGRYRAVLFVSNHPIPSSSGAPDADYAAADKAGARAIISSDVSVR